MMNTKWLIKEMFEDKVTDELPKGLTRVMHVKNFLNNIQNRINQEFY